MSSVFSRDHKLAKAALIYQEQETRRLEGINAFEKCRKVIENDFFKHLESQDHHEGWEGPLIISTWMSKHDECINLAPVDYTSLFPKETLEGKIEYYYSSTSFYWKLNP
jgi:hypothetical protein